MAIKYQIIKGISYSGYLLETSPKIYPLEVFFASIGKENLVDLCTNIFDRQGFGNQISSVVYYDELDGGDKYDYPDFTENKVLVLERGSYQEVLLERMLFEEIVFEFTLAVINFPKINPPTLGEEMEWLLEKLKK